MLKRHSVSYESCHNLEVRAISGKEFEVFKHPGGEIGQPNVEEIGKHVPYLGGPATRSPITRARR